MRTISTPRIDVAAIHGHDLSYPAMAVITILDSTLSNLQVWLARQVDQIRRHREPGRYQEYITAIGTISCIGTATLWHPWAEKPLVELQVRPYISTSARGIAAIRLKMEISRIAAGATGSAKMAGGAFIVAGIIILISSVSELYNGGRNLDTPIDVFASVPKIERHLFVPLPIRQQLHMLISITEEGDLFVPSLDVAGGQLKGQRKVVNITECAWAVVH